MHEVIAGMDRTALQASLFLQPYVESINPASFAGLQDDFGEPVGRLDQFVNERLLPAAPTNEVEDCKQQ